MLSLQQKPDRLRSANNLIPTGDGTMKSRPGAIQLVSGDISHVQPWGNKALLEKQGRIILWDGSEVDIAPAGYHLQATAFQAYTANGNREDRLYIADGIKPLWYLTRLGAGSYQQTTVVNTVTDANGIPYAIPIPKTLATWRNRLFIGDGSNRIYHCQNIAPDEWDPLWSLEFQTDSPDTVQCIKPDGDLLFLGLTKSCFSVSGTSHLNWQRSPIAGANGVTGQNAIATDGDHSYWVSRTGIETNQQGFSDSDIHQLFETNVSDSHIEIDSRRRLLFTLIRNRLFVMHMDNPGHFGEITGANVKGLVAFDDYIGWYGENGLWVLGMEDEPDRLTDGSVLDFQSFYETWDLTPNEEGASTLSRAFIKIRGSARGSGTYTLKRDNVVAYSNTFTLNDHNVDLGSDIGGGADGEYIAPAPVIRELTPHVSGVVFSHAISADCHMEIVKFSPKYKHKG